MIGGILFLSKSVKSTLIVCTSHKHVITETGFV